VLALQGKEEGGDAHQKEEGEGGHEVDELEQGVAFSSAAMHN